MFEEIGKHLIPWANNSWAPPFRIHIFPTDACNLKCGSCWRWAVSPDGHVDSSSYELPREIIMRIIEEAAKLGVKTWEITGGGEPLVRKDVVIEMIQRIKKLGMKGTINSNGTLYTSELVKFLIDIEWDNLIISLDGPDSEINDSLRPPHSFNRIITTLKLFKELKALYNKHHPIIYIHSVLSKINFTNIVKMIKLAIQYDVSSINFEPLKHFSQNCEDLLLSEEEDFNVIRRLAKEGSEMAQKNNLITNLGCFLSTPQLLVQSGNLTKFLKSFSEAEEKQNEFQLLSACCFEPWYRLFITTKGEVSPCCLGPFFPDNVKEKSLKEIWLGRNFSNFRNRILNRNLPPTCNKCNASLFIHSRHIQSLFKKALDEHKRSKKSSIFLRTNYNYSNSLNICLISREYPPETGWGGIGTYTYHLAHGLANLGHQVHVIAQSLDADKEYIDGKVFVYRIAHQAIFYNKGFLKEFALRLEYSRRVYTKLKQLIKKYHLDIIESPNFSGETFVYSLFKKKLPLVTRLHTHFSEVILFLGWKKTLDRSLSCWIENFVILKSDLIICSTERHKESVFTDIGLKPKNTEIISLGVPLPSIKEYNKSEGNKHKVLFVGRLEKRKGIHTLIRAIPIVLEDMPETDFYIVGRDTFVTSNSVSFIGKEEKSFQAALLKSVAEEYKQNIHFLGYVESNRLSEYYQSCDIFVAPSLYESFGFIYIEAMSYAKPVIGCGVGGVPEVVKDGETGVLVPPEDPNSLAREIVRLLKNPKLRAKMGANARKHVENNFTREQMVEKTLAAYKRVLKI